MKTITATDYATAAPADHLLLDVRQPEEHAQAHVDGATLIPLGELTARLNELDAAQPLYVMCHAGGRSAQATEFLTAQGFDATNIDGGITAWIAAGLPVSEGTA